MGLRTGKSTVAVLSSTPGISERASGFSDHQSVSFSFLSASSKPTGQAAPDSIQIRIAATSAAASGFASLGIAGFAPEI
jgi:hypothetical protein